MPKKKIDYSNTIIYKIFCRDPNIKELYIGHTTNFVNRKSAHKTSCNNCNSKLYTFIREHGGWDNWKIVIIDDVECNNFEQARKVEQNYIDKYNSGLNTAIAFCIKDEEDKIKNPEKSKLQENKINIINQKKFVCETCNYCTHNKKDYNKHLFTEKHNRLINTNLDFIKNPIKDKNFKCNCGKSYKHQSSLCKHKTICKYNDKCVEIINNKDMPELELEEKIQYIIQKQKCNTEKIENIENILTTLQVTLNEINILYKK